MRPLLKVSGFWIVTLVFVLALTSVLPSRAQPPSVEVFELVQLWLNKNCGAGEENLLEERLRALGPRLEGPFLKALKQGPPSKSVAEVVNAAGLRYDERARLVGSGEGLGLSDEDLEVARSVTRKDFLDRSRRDFDLRYRTQAVVGLGIVGGSGAVRVLRRLADDGDSPLQSSARRALEQLLGDQPPG